MNRFLSSFCNIETQNYNNVRKKQTRPSSACSLQTSYTQSLGLKNVLVQGPCSPYVVPPGRGRSRILKVDTRKSSLNLHCNCYNEAWI